jgi:hypothetical protein
MLDKKAISKKPEEVVPLDVEPTEVVVEEAPPLPPQPKRYICKVQCWVSHRCQMYNPGDIVTFEPGEFVPDHFTLIGE